MMIERTRQDLFDILYGPRNLDDRVKIAAMMNLDLQTTKLVKDGMLSYDEDREVFTKIRTDRFKL